MGINRNTKRLQVVGRCLLAVNSISVMHGMLWLVLLSCRKSFSCIVKLFYLVTLFCFSNFLLLIRIFLFGVYSFAASYILEASDWEGL
jgi:hypothetical protein